MSDLSTLELFTDVVPGREVNAQRLNNAFATLRILPAFISSRGTATPVGSDAIVFLDISDGPGNSKCTFQELFTALADPAVGVSGPRTLGTGGLQAAKGNDDRFPADVTGLRKGAGAGKNDTAAVPSDYFAAPTVGTLSAGAVTLNCALNTRFTVAVSANTVITLTNVPDGANIEVRTTQTGGFTCTFTTAGLTQKWVGGSIGVVSAGAAAIDIWKFRKYGTDLYLTIEKAWS